MKNIVCGPQTPTTSEREAERGCKNFRKMACPHTGGAHMGKEGTKDFEVSSSARKMSARASRSIPMMTHRTGATKQILDLTRCTSTVTDS